MLIVLLCLLNVIGVCLGLHDGERFLASTQTLHAGWKSAPIDMVLTQLPRFREQFSTMFQIHMPRKDENGPVMDLDMSSDVKTTFTFFHDRLVVPLVLVFDSHHKRTASRITFTFAHDEYEVLRVFSTVDYGEGPEEDERELPLVEILYEYETVQEEDVAAGVFYMFLLTLLLFAVMVGVVVTGFDSRFKPNASMSHKTKAKGKSTAPPSRANKLKL